MLRSASPEPVSEPDSGPSAARLDVYRDGKEMLEDVMAILVKLARGLVRP